MNFRKYIWFLQKIQTRVMFFLSPQLNQISTRREVTDSIKILKTTEVYIGLDHYKNLPNTDFRRVLNISNSTLNPKTGILWLDEKIIKESSYWSSSELQKWEPRPYLPRKLAGTYSFLPNNGFFHFLIEDLPRYIEVNNFAPNLATISEGSMSYITDALDILKPNNYFTVQVPVKVDNIILSEKISGQVFSKNDLKLIKDAFSSYTSSSEDRSIFISRRDKDGNKFKTRGIDKREQIEESFASLGYEIVFLEELKFKDQVSMISGSKRIAGFHGAGLANIIWANQANIIEISNTRITRHFEHLSEVCSHKYSFYSTSQPISNLYEIINGSLS
jgi:hypothetical protein